MVTKISSNSPLRAVIQVDVRIDTPKSDQTSKSKIVLESHVMVVSKNDKGLTPVFANFYKNK